MRKGLHVTREALFFFLLYQPQYSTTVAINFGLEFVEQIRRIMRPSRRFRVILHTENGQAVMANAFHRLIVQIHVRYIHMTWQTGRIHSKLVISTFSVRRS